MSKIKIDHSNQSMTILGVMSGSSLDGLDLAVVKIKGGIEYEILRAATLPIESSLKVRLRLYMDLDSMRYIHLERDYSQFIGRTISNYLSSFELKIDAIGLHGHTIVHVPEEKLTIQLGNGGVVAAMTGIDVVSDFRIQDITKNGVGTPLASIVDKNLFTGYDYYLNLGGIANISHIQSENITAYDICPCNQILNKIAVEKLDLPYDAGGREARKGKLINGLTKEIDTLDYWAQVAPKSLDNNWIKDDFLPKINTDHHASDLLHTMTHWIVEKIANEVMTKEGKLFVSGGGAYNSFLIEVLENKLSNCRITVPNKDIIEYKESILMAYLTYRRINGQPNVLCMVTNADTDSIAGAYYKA